MFLKCRYNLIAQIHRSPTPCNQLGHWICNVEINVGLFTLLKYSLSFNNDTIINLKFYFFISHFQFPLEFFPKSYS